MKRWVLASLFVFAANATGASIPDEAHQYAGLLSREALALWGDNAPVARFAGQIHQESGWRPDARSKYAAGLAQFTPATARWISGLYGNLRANEPLDPAWAIPALIIYDRYLYERTRAATECDRWAMTLSGYNGGEGWRKRDQSLCATVLGCDPARWFDHVEHHSRRAIWAFTENRGYPRKILLKWEPLYIRAGWSGEAACSQ